MEVTITIDDIRLKSDLKSIQNLTFTKESFFDTILGSNDSHLEEIGDIEGFVQLIPRSYKSDESNNITGIGKVHLKCNCTNGSLLNGIREPIL